MKRQCSAKDCERKSWVDGLCAKHWKAKSPKSVKPCVIDGCDLPSKSRGMCSKHYTRSYRHGDPSTVLPLHPLPHRRKWTGPCAVEGCGRRALSRGWCGMHYQRWLNHGDPLTVLPRGGRRVPRKPATHCRSGHELSGDNVRVYTRRVCIECERRSRQRCQKRRQAGARR